MPNAGRVGTDSAGGTIVGPGEPTVLINGAPASVLGDAVAGHGPATHASATMVQGSGTVMIGGKPACRMGDTASCGDPLTPGSSDVIIGG